MLILKVRELIVCFLDNPKCGSTTFREFVYPQLKKQWKVIFESSKGIKQCNFKYKDPRYRHAPLCAAVRMLRKRGHDPTKAIFIATIREPVNRVIATFYWDMPKRGYYGVKGDRSADFLYYFHTNTHLSRFAPSRWRTFKKFHLTEILHLESFDDDLKRINHKYDLRLKLEKIPRKLVNKRKKHPLEISDSLRNSIHERYALDYKDGEYEKKNKAPVIKRSCVDLR